MNEIEFLEQQAVEAAINFDWPQAITINKHILTIDGANLGAHLRLGFSYLQSHNLNLAKKYYHKALKIQPTHQVAQENLDRIRILELRSGKKMAKSELRLDPSLFIETPGKTASVSLVNLGQKSVLAQLSIGQEVGLSQKKRKVEVRLKSAEYIGSLPDDLSRRLILFLKAKSVYQAFIKEASLSRITIFIKELKKGRHVASYLSFPTDIQAHMGDLHKDKDDDEDDSAGDSDLEKLAETLATEERDYLPYQNDAVEEEEEEE